MIEAFEHPPLSAKMIRRGSAGAAVPPGWADESVERQPSPVENLRFFAGAYLGALAFFLIWLS